MKRLNSLFCGLFVFLAFLGPSAKVDAQDLNSLLTSAETEIAVVQGILSTCTYDQTCVQISTRMGTVAGYAATLRVAATDPVANQVLATSTVTSATTELAVIQGIVEGATYLGVRQQLYTHVTTMQTTMGQIQTAFSTAATPVVPVTPPEPVGPVAMDTVTFNQLVSSINAQSFGSDQLNVLRQALGSNYITCNQLVQLLTLFDFDSDRVDAAVAAFPSLVDPQNAFTLSSSFDFSSSFSDFQSRVGTW